MDRINSRTKNSILNSIFGLLSYILVMAATMASRIAFARYLGEELLGLNSLYTSVLQILQISELGIGNAMIIFLYRPVKNKDEVKTRAVLHLYKKVYRVFACILFIIGIIVLYFVIPFIVKIETIDMKTVQVYFFLFLIGIICSYLFAYNKAIFYAEQKNRVISIVNCAQKTIVAFLQIIVIYKYRNYGAFLVIMAIGNLSENLICHYWVSSTHPYLNEQDEQPLTDKEKNEIIRLVKPIFVVRIADKVLGQSDSLIINGMIDIVTLGMYSNYHTIFNACLGLFNPIGASLTSSFGNLAVDASPNRKYMAYKKSYPVIHFVSVFFCVLFLSLIQDFISISYGEKYVLKNSTSILMTVYLYYSLVTTIYYSYQNAMGLHRLDQKQMVVRIPFNIVVSILLARICGLDGIIIGTILSIVFFSMCYKGPYLFKIAFEENVKKYYSRTIWDSILTVIVLIIAFTLSRMIQCSNVPSFIFKSIGLSFILLMLTLGLFMLSRDFRTSLRLMIRFVLKK